MTMTGRGVGLQAGTMYIYIYIHAYIQYTHPIKNTPPKYFVKVVVKNV